MAVGDATSTTTPTGAPASTSPSDDPAEAAPGLRAAPKTTPKDPGPWRPEATLQARFGLGQVEAGKQKPLDLKLFEITAEGNLPLGGIHQNRSSVAFNGFAGFSLLGAARDGGFTFTGQPGEVTIGAAPGFVVGAGLSVHLRPHGGPFQRNLRLSINYVHRKNFFNLKDHQDDGIYGAPRGDVDAAILSSGNVTQNGVTTRLSYATLGAQIACGAEFGKLVLTHDVAVPGISGFYGMGVCSLGVAPWDAHLARTGKSETDTTPPRPVVITPPPVVIVPVEAHYTGTITDILAAGAQTDFSLDLKDDLESPDAVNLTDAYLVPTGDFKADDPYASAKTKGIPVEVKTTGMIPGKAGKRVDLKPRKVVPQGEYVFVSIPQNGLTERPPLVVRGVQAQAEASKTYETHGQVNNGETVLASNSYEFTGSVQLTNVPGGPATFDGTTFNVRIIPQRGKPIKADLASKEVSLRNDAESSITVKLTDPLAADASGKTKYTLEFDVIKAGSADKVHVSLPFEVEEPGLHILSAQLESEAIKPDKKPVLTRLKIDGLQKGDDVNYYYLLPDNEGRLTKQMAVKKFVIGDPNATYPLAELPIEAFPGMKYAVVLSPKTADGSKRDEKKLEFMVADKSGDINVPSATVLGNILTMVNGFFEPDQASLKDDPNVPILLDMAAGYLKTHPNIKKVTMKGHADKRPSTKYKNNGGNQKLTEERANTMSSKIKNRGVTQTLEAVGMGDKYPKSGVTKKGGKWSKGGTTIKKADLNTALQPDRRVEVEVQEELPAPPVADPIQPNPAETEPPPNLQPR